MIIDCCDLEKTTKLTSIFSGLLLFNVEFCLLVIVFKFVCLSISVGILVCLLIVVLSPPEQDCFCWKSLNLVLNLN